MPESYLVPRPVPGRSRDDTLTFDNKRPMLSNV